jgi:hypothetical protein
VRNYSTVYTDQPKSASFLPPAIGFWTARLAVLVFWDDVILLFYISVLFKTFFENYGRGSSGFLCRLIIRGLGQNPEDFDDFKPMTTGKNTRTNTGLLQASNWHILD